MPDRLTNPERRAFHHRSWWPAILTLGALAAICACLALCNGGCARRTSIVAPAPDIMPVILPADTRNQV